MSDCVQVCVYVSHTHSHTYSLFVGIGLRARVCVWKMLVSSEKAHLSSALALILRPQIRSDSHECAVRVGVYTPNSAVT